MLESLYRDARIGIRSLLEHPAFSGIAVLVLGIGIGANTALFSLVNIVLLRPPGIEAPERLQQVYSKDTAKTNSYRSFSYPNYVDLRARNDVFKGLAAFELAMVGLGEGEDTRRVFASVVSFNYFQTLGVSLELGRPFDLEEERAIGGGGSAIIGYPLWRRYGFDPKILGQTIRVNGHTYSVVGVLPESFQGPSAVLPIEVFLALGAWPSVENNFGSHAVRPLDARDNHQLMVVGRLRDDLKPQKAETQLQGLALQMQAEFPEVNRDQTLILRPVPRFSISNAPKEGGDDVVAAVCLLLMGMGGILLLIACLNLGHMQAARSATRGQEFAIRMALGGSRRRIVQQLLVEGMLLSLAGGLIGMLFSVWAPAALTRSMSQVLTFDMNFRVTPDWRVGLATLVFCALSTLFFALRPALRLSRRTLFENLKAQRSSGHQGAQKKGFFRGRNLPVVSEVALSLALLIVAGLFIRGALEAAGMDPGFETRGAVVLETDLSLLGYDEPQSRRVYEDLLERLRNHPGVEAASLTSQIPFGLTSSSRSLQRIDRPFSEDPSENPSALFNLVSSGFFQSLELPLLDGRDFSLREEQTAQPVVVIDQRLAEELWPGEQAVGKHLKLKSEPDSPLGDLEVVGVAANMKVDFFDTRENGQLFIPLGLTFHPAVHFVVRASDEAVARSLLPDVRSLARSVDSRMPVLSLRTLSDHLKQSPSFWLVQVAAFIFTSLGLLSLLLAVVGVYGVRAFAVVGRTREIGVRMALGASVNDTVWMVLREGLVITLVGSTLGILLALGLAQVVQSLLYEVSATDPLTFVLGTLALAVVMLLACYLPARRAARVDPIEALRFE